jgi:DNA-binding response OmpR family regulator
MRILVADDEEISRRVNAAAVSSWGHTAIEAPGAAEALAILDKPEGPRLALVDLVMPGMDGIELCRRARAAANARPLHLIMLTVRTDKADVVAALSAGADDYIVKPFHPPELRARVEVGARLVGLQEELRSRIEELERSLERESELTGLLPMCAYCHKVRDDKNYWERVENYVAKLARAHVSHGVCPECYEKLAREAGLER